MKPLKDIYWLAGFLEGEGSFSPRPKQGLCPVMRATTTDEDVARKAASIIGVDVNGPYSQTVKTYKPFWVIIAYKRSPEWMMTIYSLMGSRRKAQIRASLESWKKKK